MNTMPASRLWRRLALLCCAWGLGTSLAAQTVHRLDSSASPRQKVAALQVLNENGRPFAQTPFSREAHAQFGRVEFRLSTAAFVGRRARIDLVLPPSVPGLRRASGLVYHWRGVDGTLSGQVYPGQRLPVWTGTIEQALTTLSIDLGMRLDVTAMGDSTGGQVGVEPVFELAVLP